MQVTQFRKSASRSALMTRKLNKISVTIFFKLAMATSKYGSQLAFDKINEAKCLPKQAMWNKLYKLEYSITHCVTQQPDAHQVHL